MPQSWRPARFFMNVLTLLCIAGELMRQNSGMIPQFVNGCGTNAYTYTNRVRDRAMRS
jgi:hypothetical protein